MYRFLYLRDLSRLPEGGTMWFWLTDQAQDGEPILALVDRGNDPLAGTLKQMIRRAAPQPGARTFHGQADIGPTGAVRFFLSTEQPDFLPTLARFVRRFTEEMIEVRRLAGAQVIVTESDSARQTEDDALWAGVLSATIPASAAVQRFGVSQTLQSMSEAEAVWFWLSETGPGALPALILQRKDEQTDGALLARRIKAMMAAGAGGTTARGIARVETVKGRKRLCFVTEDDWPTMLTSLGAWTAAHLPDERGLRRLLNARHMHLGADPAQASEYADQKMWKAIARGR